MGASVARQFDSTSAYNVMYGTYRTQVGNTTIKNQNSKLINIGVKQGGIEGRMRDKREFYTAARKETRKREKREKNLTQARAPNTADRKNQRDERYRERGG